MRSRPRTSFVKALKRRRCGKCGSKLGTLVNRCRHCHSLNGRPKK